MLIAEQWKKRGTPHAISGMNRSADTVADRAHTGHKMIGADQGVNSRESSPESKKLKSALGRGGQRRGKESTSRYAGLTDADAMHEAEVRAHLRSA